jgi:phosphoglycerol transferase MdoB-like AlkP superfamily enzyme
MDFLFFGRRIRPIWILTLACLLIFASFRVGLLIARRHDLFDVTWLQIAKSMLIGMRYDAWAIAFAAAPLILAFALVPPGVLDKKAFRYCAVTYCTVCVVIVIFVEIASTVYFFDPRQGATTGRPGIEAIDNLFDSKNKETLSYILHDYAFAMAMVAVLLAAMFYLLLRMGNRFLLRGRHSDTIPLLLARTIVLGAVCFLAIRGAGEKPLNTGQAYFSRNWNLAQISLNNWFTLAQGLRCKFWEEDAKLLPDNSPQAALVKKMVYQPADTAIPNQPNPLLRHTATGRPMADYNIVVIVMEGMAGKPVGALGYHPSATPFFDSLCKQGLYFQWMFMVGPRTSRGIIGVLCGYPDLQDEPAILRQRAQGRFISLPGIFRDRGYRTLFAYGGDPNFDNMKGFLSAAGVEQCIGESDLDIHGLKTGWGAHDEVTLHAANQAFDRMGDKKFFGIVLTLSNHEPFEVPRTHPEFAGGITPAERNFNSYRYADWCLKEFFQEAGACPYFKHTIFLLVSDHGRGTDRSKFINMTQDRVPAIIYAPGIIEPQKIPAVCSQVDLAPTLLAIMGGEYTHCFFGRNMLAVPEDDEGFAMLHERDRLTLVKGRSVVIAPDDAAATLHTYDLNDTTPVPPSPQSDKTLAEMKEQLLSYYAIVQDLYLKGQYNTNTKRP